MEEKFNNVLDKVAEISASMTRLQSDIDFVRTQYTHVPEIQLELEMAQRKIDINQQLLEKFNNSSVTKLW